MPLCKLCSKKGIFLWISKNGLCKLCDNFAVTDVNRRAQIIQESMSIMDRTTNSETKTSRCNVLLDNAKALVKYEKIGIPTISPLPSELIRKYSWELQNSQWHIQAVRNIKGKELEKSGRINEAIELYEKNIAEEFDGNRPYDRLAIIYRKRKQYDEEIRVLEKAIAVFENKVHPDRPDKNKKLTRFKERLKKAKDLQMKQNVKSE
jgi:tetratricopeptide (TPR) repeat protein